MDTKTFLHNLLPLYLCLACWEVRVLLMKQSRILFSKISSQITWQPRVSCTWPCLEEYWSTISVHLTIINPRYIYWHLSTRMTKIVNFINMKYYLQISRILFDVELLVGPSMIVESAWSILRKAFNHPLPIFHGYIVNGEWCLSL